MSMHHNAYGGKPAGSLVAPSRFLSEADCHDIAQRLSRFTKGGGETIVTLLSRWVGNVRWARNRVTTSGDDQDNYIHLVRSVRGANCDAIHFNSTSDVELVAAARRAERLVQDDLERVDSDLITRPDSRARPQEEPVVAPSLFFESTFGLDDERRAAVAREHIQPIVAAGMLSAGYVEVSATSMAYITSWGYTKYYQYTWARYSVTVRDPSGTGSGWAGVDWPDWAKIDGEKLSALALDKCLKSRNPVAVEPGRYTVILEPQAVGDFIGLLTENLYNPNRLDRKANEDTHNPGIFTKTPGDEPPYRPLGMSLIGEKVIDERLTISADPMDPDMGFPPYFNFMFGGQRGRAYPAPVYHPVVWIERGILKHLSYDRSYAYHFLGQQAGLENSGAFRMSVTGQTASVEEMIAATKRGLLVTRFDSVSIPAGRSLLSRGYTRDGLWLIENGKISQAVKNMQFTESILFALNNVEQVGVPQRIFHPCEGWLAWWRFASVAPMFVPALRIKDFSFTALSDAV